MNKHEQIKDILRSKLTFEQVIHLNEIADQILALDDWVSVEDMVEEITLKDQQETIEIMREAMQEFVDRCYKGEVRSRYTFDKFKRILKVPLLEKNNG